MTTKKKTNRAIRGDVQTSASRTEPQFSRDQLLACHRFQDRQDLVCALLAADRRYTVAAVEQKIKSYMKGKVK